ncbi:MAG: iron uptake porin [Cyanobacteria bacterium J06639_18]
MRKFSIPKYFTSVILGYGLLTLSPVLAQEKKDNYSETVSDLQSFNLQQSFNSQQSLNSQSQIKKNSTFPGLLSQTPRYREPPRFDGILNVNELEDVSPGDWAYEALRSLVEKYRCITGSSEQNFNGNRVMTRYEFAAGLNACLLKIGRSIYSLNNRFSDQEELAVVQRLQTEFATELKTITAKIDNIEERVNFLKERQFSPTTVLRGTVDFNLISAFGNSKAVSPSENPTEELDEIPVLSARTSLSFDTSFTGKDRLRARVQGGNVSNFGADFTGTDMTRLVGATNTGNDIRLGTLFYEFPVGERGIIAIAPAADFPTRIFPALNPVSSISNFGGESPIYSFAFGAGAVAYYQFTDELAAGISYLTTSGSNPDEGLFNGQYTALTQVTYTPSDKVGVALTYGRYYAPDPGSTVNITGNKGSEFAQLPFGADTATSSDALGLQFTYKLNDKLILGGWASYFNANAKTSPSVSGFSGSSESDADIWSWAITASLKDLGKLGSQLSFVFGMPPKVTNNDVVEREDEDTSLHFELSYRYPLTDRIFITPGFLAITNPEHNADNDTIWVGLMRTSFNF